MAGFFYDGEWLAHAGLQFQVSNPLQRSGTTQFGRTDVPLKVMRELHFCGKSRSKSEEVGFIPLQYAASHFPEEAKGEPFMGKFPMTECRAGGVLPHAVAMGVLAFLWTTLMNLFPVLLV